MQRAAKRLSYLALMTLASVMTLNACGEKSPSAKAADAPTPAPPVAATPAPQPPAPVPTVAAAQPPAPVAAGATQPQVTSGLGTSDFEVAGVEVTLLELKRTSGDTLTARWRYRNIDKDCKQLTKATGWTDPWRLAWDSYLIDGTNKKKYMILKDTEGKPIAAAHGSGAIKLAGGQTLNTWAKYPAPPENVQKVSAYLPGVAPFEDVPISK
jgi:hypothetical protein